MVLRINFRSSLLGSAVTNLTSIRKDAGLIPGLAMNWGVGHRHGSHPMLLWLWHRPAAAAPIQPLAWQLPYAIGVALKRSSPTQKKKKISKALAGLSRSWLPLSSFSIILCLLSSTPHTHPHNLPLYLQNLQVLLRLPPPPASFSIEHLNLPTRYSLLLGLPLFFLPSGSYTLYSLFLGEKNPKILNDNSFLCAYLQCTMMFTIQNQAL